MPVLRNGIKKHDNQERETFTKSLKESSCAGIAKWQESNGQKYLEIISKDHYTLGRLQGKYLKRQIKKMNFILKRFVMFYDLKMDEIRSYSKAYEKCIPIQYKEELKGVSEVSGVEYDDLLFQVVFLDLFYGQLLPRMESRSFPISAACTAIGVRDTNNHYVMGQTMDFNPIFSPALSWVKYKVMGANTVFLLKMGIMSLPIGKNSRVSATLNLVQTK
ncbi:MAG: hypothetical protein EU539_10405, partial [Promethearchaeota archaeon]